MSVAEKNARYILLVRETERTVLLLESQGMTEQANRHRECAALLSVLAMRFSRGGAA